MRDITSDTEWGRFGVTATRKIFGLMKEEITNCGNKSRICKLKLNAFYLIFLG